MILELHSSFWVYGLCDRYYEYKLNACPPGEMVVIPTYGFALVVAICDENVTLLVVSRSENSL